MPIGPLKVALQNLSESGQEAYVLFVDIIKAFDTVNREMLWQILARYGVPDHLVSVIKKLYAEITVKLRVGKAKGSFESTSGVKQGDPLAPILFLYVMQAAIETMDQSWLGIKPQFEWSPLAHDENGQPLYRGCLTRRNSHASHCERHEHYTGILADDLGLIFLSMLDLQNGSKHVRNCFLLFGLKIHIGVRGGGKDGKDSESKTFAMLIPKLQDRKHLPQPESYDLDDETFVPFCTKFKYLGSTITCDLDDTTEIERHLSLAHMTFNKFRKLLCNQRIRVDLRGQLYQMCVLSVLLAGCETWAVKHSHLTLLTSFHNRCTRAMCGLNLWHCWMHKISTENILQERLKMLPLDIIFYQRQLRFLHRVACMDPSRLTFQALSSQAARLPGMKMAAGKKVNTLSTWKNTLEKSGLSSEKSGGKLEEWIPNIRGPNCTTIVEEKLGLPPGSFKFKPRPIHPHTGF